MKKRILIAEDELDLLEIMELILVQNDFDVTTTTNGELAKAILETNNFDLIVSDGKMPKMGGIDLFKWTKQNKPTPFLLVTGFSEISNEEQALTMGMSGFLEKPFNMDQLSNSVKTILNTKKQSADDLEEYSKISINHFLHGYKFPYSIYIQLNATKMQKISHSGDALERERIEKYKSNNVEFLFVKKEDFKSFINSQLSLMKNELSNSNDTEMANLTKKLSKDIYNKIYIDGIDEDLFTYSKEVVELAITNLCNEEQAKLLLKQISDGDSDIYLHSLSVSVYSVMAAKKLNYDSEKDINNIALGAFFHDIGRSDISIEDLHLDEKHLSKINEEVIGEHPERGYLIMSQIKGIDEEVLNIILNHEDAYRTSKLTREDGKVSLSHIVCIVNQFCNFIANKEKTDEIKDLVQKLKDEEKNANIDVIQAIGSLFIH